VIADSGATPDFVASDLLSQAEHGPDSQVILLTPDADMARAVADAVERQLADLPRAETARKALSASRLIVAKDLAQCVQISNQYGPEHLIIQTRSARDLVDDITSAGSVFLGDWSPSPPVIMPPAPTTSCQHTVIPQPAPAWAGRFPETDDRPGIIARRLRVSRFYY
jgi:histidinol dehydrogenase